MESQLPAFSFDAVVTPQQGRQDKMEIILPWGTLEGCQSGIDGVRQALGSAAMTGRSQLTQSDLQGSGWIFNRPQQTRTARKPLTIRQRPCILSDGDILTAPLFSGGLSFSNYYRGSQSSATSAKLRLSLNLNPTRFAHHQRPRFGADGSAMIEPPQLTFRHRALPASFRGEMPLHECDNWIPDGQRYAHFFQASFWPRFVQNYVTGTLDVIRAEMDRASQAHDVYWTEGETSPLSLRYVETYWEFVTPDPLKAVSDCECLLRAYTENPTRKRFFKTVAEGTVVHNSRSFTVSVQTGVDLVIYAKTNRRVRVEVRHSLSESASVIGGSYMAGSVQKLCRWLRVIQADAAKIVNQAFQFMRGRNTFPQDSVSVGQFLFDMVGAVGKWEGAGALLSMLLHNGKIVTDAHLRPHVHALRDAGIIKAQRKNRQRCYIIAERYKRALELLTTSNKSLLDVRQRRRVLRPNREF
jgi:hypothetical protein